MVGGGVRRRRLHGRIFPWTNFSWGKGIFHDGVPDSPLLFKKTIRN